MPINLDKPHLWKADIARSVDCFNQWFVTNAPMTFRESRTKAVAEVAKALAASNHLVGLAPALLIAHPTVLPTLRMCCCPPIARDRLIGLAQVSPGIVRSMELDGRIPPKLDKAQATAELAKVCAVITKLVDHDLLPWVARNQQPTSSEAERAALVVADRLCGAIADPIIRNAQEARQLSAIATWLNALGYRHVEAQEGMTLKDLPTGHYCFRFNVKVSVGKGDTKPVNIPIDVAVNPRQGKSKTPLLIEAKSAGDFTNTNKRRKEEATKANQLREAFGPKTRYILFLCGYFDSGYLGYEAAENIDWVWEHRIDDLAKFNL